MKRTVIPILVTFATALTALGQTTSTVKYRLGLQGTYTPGPVCPPNCGPADPSVAYVHGNEASGQVFSPDETPEIRWDAVCEVSGPNQGGANLIIDLRVRRDTVSGPIATEATFSGDTGQAANFSYGVSTQASMVAPITYPVSVGGPNMSFSSTGTTNPGKLDVLGAGYINWINPSQVVAGVGRLTMPSGTPGLPDGTAGLGHVPIFDGKISISNLPAGTYHLVLLQEGHAINVLRGDVDLTQSAGSFARRADVTPNTSISFVVDRGASGSDIDNDGVADTDDNCPSVANSSQADGDNDGVGDICDNCPNDANADQEDEDNNGMGDVCDSGTDGDTPVIDSDSDNVPDSDDRCPGFDDRIDVDQDGVPDSCDNCFVVKNADQADTDGDGVGDACDDQDDTDEPPDQPDPPDDTDDGDGSTDDGGSVAPGPCGVGLVETGLVSSLMLCVAGLPRRRRI